MANTTGSGAGKTHGVSHKEPSEDWMIVLDNFLDNDEQGNQHRVQHQQFQHSNNKGSSNNLAPLIGATSVNSSTGVTSSVSQGRTAGSSTGPSTNSCPPSSNSAPSNQQVSESNAGTDFMENPDLSEEKKAQIRSERKRNREKQRRSDVNSQFAALTELLKRVEGYDLDSDVSDDEDEKETKKRKVNPVGGVMNITPSNRVDLIARTIAVMDRLHQVNRSLRQNVKELRKTLSKVKLGNEKSTNGMNQQGFINGMVGGGMGGNSFGGGMMMMVPQQMGCQAPQSQGDSQKSMMMMVPMMMPNQMMNGNMGPQFMPNMNNMMNPFMQQGQGQNPQQQVQQQGSQQMPSMSQGLHQQQGNQPTQHPQPSFTQMNSNGSNNGMDANSSSSPAAMNPAMQYVNVNTQEQASNQQMPRSQAASMAVYNPITNAWNVPGGQMQGQQQQSQHPLQTAMSDSNVGNNQGGGDDAGPSSYGGNLAHCA